MSPKSNPVLLAGGNRGGIGYAQRLSCTPGRQTHRRRTIECVHGFDARVFELLGQIDRHELGGDLDRLLAQFVNLNPATPAAFGSDRFPADSLYVVGGAR